MSLKETIQNNLKEAMRAKEGEKLSTLRMLMSAMTNKEIDLRKKDIGLSDEEVIEVIRSEVKKRKDAMAEFEKGKRDDLVQKEKKEFEILQEYLPPEMSDEELRSRIGDAIRETNAQGMKDFGIVMKTLMPVVKGKASGDRISVILKEQLGR